MLPHLFHSHAGTGVSVKDFTRAHANINLGNEKCTKDHINNDCHSRAHSHEEKKTCQHSHTKSCKHTHTHEHHQQEHLKQEDDKDKANGKHCGHNHHGKVEELKEGHHEHEHKENEKHCGHNHHGKAEELKEDHPDHEHKKNGKHCGHNHHGKVEELKEDHNCGGGCSGHGYPWGALFAGITFFFMIGIDKMMHAHGATCNHSHQHGNHESSCSSKTDPEKGHEQIEIHFHEVPIQASKSKALIFIISLGIHSFIEGMGAGASEGRRMWSMFISLLAHKGLESFALGMSIFNAKFSKTWSFLIIALIALLTPLGCGLGIGLDHLISSLHRETFDSIINGLASGSFLYISCIEMIPSVLGGHYQLPKYIIMLVGFSAMAIIQIFH
ncbi:Zip-domain-containing protein [Rozella allomycis CSF55]|uniref:Zip-domain-containing protein n=1 Tax=Rozella allomycis (strain CSF55) TaxID=988480 RepID=A0A4P9YQT2_ROZAC|nr:Zip-domain-containing protein [Rozella allomycis CSF55]